MEAACSSKALTYTNKYQNPGDHNSALSRGPSVGRGRSHVSGIISQKMILFNVRLKLDYVRLGLVCATHHCASNCSPRSSLEEQLGRSSNVKLGSPSTTAHLLPHWSSNW
jgi:hypothetical protein